jgi:hypothetical protein
MVQVVALAYEHGIVVAGDRGDRGRAAALRA